MPGRCEKCRGLKTREEWAKLISCYLVYYSCLTGWFALHLGVMLSVLPSDSPSFVNGNVRLAEPRFTTLINAGLFITEGLTDPSSTCLSSNLPGCAINQTLSITTQYDTRRVTADTTITCTADVINVDFVNCVDLYNIVAGPSANPSGNTGRSCTGGTSLVITLPENDIAPYKWGFTVQPAVGSSSSFGGTVNCKIDTSTAFGDLFGSGADEVEFDFSFNIS